MVADECNGDENPFGSRPSDYFGTMALVSTLALVLQTPLTFFMIRGFCGKTGLDLQFRDTAVACVVSVQIVLLWGWSFLYAPWNLVGAGGIPVCYAARIGALPGIVVAYASFLGFWVCAHSFFSVIKPKNSCNCTVSSSAKNVCGHCGRTQTKICEKILDLWGTCCWLDGCILHCISCHSELRVRDFCEYQGFQFLGIFADALWCLHCQWREFHGLKPFDGCFYDPRSKK